MKAVRFHEFGGPEVLSFEDVEDPEPLPGEALIRARAAAINHVDLDVRAGVSRMPIPLPHVPGLEFAGEVVAIRGGGANVKEGDRVWVPYTMPCHRCEFCLTGRDNSCDDRDTFGLTRQGGYAELVAAPARYLRPLPGNLLFEDAAAAQIALSTAWHVLINRASLQAGQTVLIHAAGSGIGSAAIQIANFAGAVVFTTASTNEKLRRAEDLGARHLINYARDDFAECVMDLTAGRGVDVIMEHVGGDVFAKSLECLKKDGVMVVVGGHAGEVAPLDIIPFFRRQLRLMGSSRATQLELDTVMRLVAEGALKPVVYRVLPLAEAAEAHRIVDSREAFGKVLLLP